MPCSRCTVVPSADLGRQIIYLKSPTEGHGGRIRTMLRELNLSFEEEGGLFRIEPTDFASFFNRIHEQKYFNEMEARDLRVLPLSPGARIGPEHLMDVQSLSYWTKLTRGRELLSVLERGAIKTLFHPIVDVSSGEIFAHEALSRGMDERGGIISPAALFPRAKDLGLLFNLDRQCREAAIRSASQAGLRGKLFINFTPTSIYDPSQCLETTHAALEASDLEPSDVVFEVVETEFVEDYGHLRQILDHYKERGYGVALDDVGSGNASLMTFFDLAPDYIKIDQELIKGIATKERHRYLLETLIQLAKRSDVKLVAEGVEEARDAAYLVEAGVDYLQGYYFSHPAEEPLKQVPQGLYSELYRSERVR